MFRLVGRLVVVVVLTLVPALAFAQAASITGVVRDSSGAVLPGVTVEAASPALIEKVRSVVTDGSGQYRIVDLRPGTYTLTFSLTGFNTVRRPDIELAGSFAATVSVDLRVGALEETITVTGETPVVDVQSVRTQRVLDKEIIDAVPTGRTAFNLASLIPGVVTSGGQDVGGSVGAGNLPNLSIHGGRSGDQRIMVDGLSIQSLECSGGCSAYVPNIGSSQEVTVDISGASAEASQGGVRVNAIPKEGGNRYSGTFFGTFANESMQGSNYSTDLQNRGLRTPNNIKRLYEVNPGLGGPLKRDKVWFYLSWRTLVADSWVAGMFYNKNQSVTTLPDAWLYAPDLSRPANNRARTRSVNGRITWQADQRNKVALFYDDQTRCPSCPGAGPNADPEAQYRRSEWAAQRFVTATWSSPVTSRLLLEAGALNRFEGWHNARIPDPTRIPVTEQSTGLQYHGLQTNNYGASFPSFEALINTVRASASYVTGSHAFKAGFNDIFGRNNRFVRDNLSSTAYRFNNGIPNQITQKATPFEVRPRLKADLGIYVQDNWTMERLTLNLGLRFDYFNNYIAETPAGPGPFVPNRNVVFPETKVANWKDLSPRLGAAYDVFGTGKTAVKVSLNRYVIGNTLQGTFGEAVSPIVLTATSVTRTWTDSNSNFVPDCNLLDVAANGECGVMSNSRFGLPLPTTEYDPATLRGWFNRGYNWEFSTSVQHEIVPRLSANVGYFRRWFGNLTVTDNRAVSAADYSPYSVTSPVDSRLPDGGGKVISGLYDLNPNRVGAVDNYFTFASNYGTQIENWHGVDVTLDARLQNGIVVQGGLSTGRTLTDNCEVRTKVPEVGPTSPYCRVETAYLSQVKFLGTYTIPRIDVQTSATFQSLPGPQISANFIASNALVQPSLGRPLTGTTNVTVNLVEPGTMYGERLNQLDMRLGKILRFGQMRAAVNLDLYNLLNTDTVLSENANFAAWRTPQSILTARFAKFSVQLDF